MTNPVHLLSVAVLLLVAFVVGAVVGTVARLLAMRLARKPAVVVAAPVETAFVAPPLVAAPVIAPLPVASAPIMPAPADVPVPDFAATLIALANEAPPAAFVEASKALVEPVPTARPLPEIRAVPAMTPLPAVVVPPASAMRPAHIAGETTSGVQVAAPQHENPPPPVEAPAQPLEQRTADVILFPIAAAEPPPARPSDIVIGGETVVVVDTSDLAVAEPADVRAPSNAAPVVIAAVAEREPTPSIAHEDNFLFVDTPALVAATPVLSAAPKPDAKSDTIPIPVFSVNAAVGAIAMAELPVPEVVMTTRSVTEAVKQPTAVAEQAAPAAVPPPEKAVPVVSTPASQPIMEQPKPAVTPVAPAPQPEEPLPEPLIVAPKPAPQAETPVVQPQPQPVAASLYEPLDEDAAMRAIEGNWSPKRPPPRRPVRTDAAPEGANQAVAASARAVIAARRTAESVVAEVAEAQAEVKAEAGRPAGLDGPRDGRKDDLTHIIGVLPVIETALNKLGLYHFDQVGGLTDEQIGWIEGHLGVPGRISRELWREQARELSAVLRPKRVAEK